MKFISLASKLAMKISADKCFHGYIILQINTISKFNQCMCTKYLNGTLKAASVCLDYVVCEVS